MDAKWPNGEPVRTPLAITSIKAFLAIDPETGTEGVTAFHCPPYGMMPMVCADEARVASMRPIAEDMARRGAKIKLVEFSVRRDVEVFE